MSKEEKASIPEEKNLKDGINYKISKFIDDHRVGTGATIIAACTAIGAVFGGVGALPGAGIGATIAGFALKASRDTVQHVESKLDKKDHADIPHALSEDRSATPALTAGHHTHHAADVMKHGDKASEVQHVHAVEHIIKSHGDKASEDHHTHHAADVINHGNEAQTSAR